MSVVANFRLSYRYVLTVLGTYIAAPPPSSFLSFLSTAKLSVEIKQSGLYFDNFVSLAVFILKTSLTNNLYGGLSSSGIKTGRVYQTSLEADEFKISDELNRPA